MNTYPPLLTYASTDPVAIEERLAYWDKYNAAALIGLRTSSLSESGLTARQANGTLDTMRVAEIEGNDHVIERNPRLVKEFPKESIFACHLVKGNAYFIQGGQSQSLTVCDTIIYDTRRPFTFGFLSDMRELLVDIPVTELAEQWDIRADELPLKIAPTPGVGIAVGAEFRRVLTSYLRDPAAESAESLPARTHMLLRSMVKSSRNGASALEPSVFYVLQAKGYIAQNLSDTQLTPTNVAVKVGVSVRHLNRLFAAERTSLSDYIWAQRAARAYRDLVTHAGRKVTIGEIAFRWGFSSQAHFCRTIVARYGMTPSDILRSPNSAPRGTQGV
ncbi:transcriptional regulator, AraC family [Burkholderia sp. WP9]|uniref:helix-turn-helix domain-containing protein n=1 Tax=Burkholderiaceae TaxID=119060 RepID=UPI000898942D|nr:helix-turn-helix domain-containing protein [Burkholderia sp. WP9]SEF07703.1 transcriptional regulator, AraC family [Burkholderia sp. WP9]